MSVKIRCRRAGANNDPCFRVVATDSRAPRDGEALEIVGWYDPKRKGKNYSLKLERIEYWLARGAILSETVVSLLRRARKEAGAVAQAPAPAGGAAAATPAKQ